MREGAFVARRRPGWEKLEALLARSNGRGVQRLSGRELQELALLYRAATADLATVQSRNYTPELGAYLNRLTARGYIVVHAGAARSGWSHVAEFFGQTFPREVRGARGIIAATSALFIVAAVAAYFLVWSRASNAYALLPAEAIPYVVKSLHDSNFAFDRTSAPAMSSLIVTNNIKVAMLAFAGGMTLGVLTLWEILTNGLMLGALGALFTHKGFGTDFWATVAPHGAIELTSIQIAGAAGLLLAQAIVAPGRLRRSDALKANARRAGTLLIGASGLLVIAGAIEGFVTPQRSSELFRLGFGALTAALLAAYFTLAGARRTMQP